MKLNSLLLICILLTACGTTTTATPPIAASPAPVSTVVPTPTPIPVTATPEGICPGTLPDGFIILGYLPEYRTLNPEWGQCLTDIAYFSAEPRPDGTLDTSRLSDETWRGLRAMKAEYGTRLHLTVGGWERSAGFAPMTSNPNTRALFVQNLLVFAQEHGLDGADFDWEFPENDEEFENYIALLTEVKAVFVEHGLTVSVALSADNASTMDLSRFAVVDRVHVMSYDRGNYHATYNASVEDMNTFTINNISPGNLLLGVPFYGRLTSEPYTATSYQELMSLHHPPADVDEVNGIYFNGIDTIGLKTCFAREGGYGGIMIWELGQGTWDETSLLQAIHQAAVLGCDVK
ncbi:MAG: glycoside hydrolase family 18 protein [Chloroflexi bacterium]|nr:glycoside hydrolase family 18 protein [Chloroflexota bacterium]